MAQQRDRWLSEEAEAARKSFLGRSRKSLCPLAPHRGDVAGHISLAILLYYNFSALWQGEKLLDLEEIGKRKGKERARSVILANWAC